MSRVIRLAIAAVLAVALAVVMSGPAQADNTRVSISNFQWSKNAEIDLGESVIWDWLGPDTLHSVSGQAPNATQWDSDPGAVEAHPLGDTFSVTFGQPGVYTFQCKLHASVRGTVTVSSNPGNPDSNPGPQPPVNLDIVPPNLTSPLLTKTRFGWGGKDKGTGLRFGINERSTVSADYFRLIRKGRDSRTRWVRKFVGFDEWRAHVGFNFLRFGRKADNFRAAPGGYVARVFAEDESFNSTPTFELKFDIVAPRRK